MGFKPRIVKEANGAASALAFVAAGFGVAVVGEPLQKIPAKDMIFRDLAPEDSAWMAVGAAWKPNALRLRLLLNSFTYWLKSAATETRGVMPLRIVI